jgi:hypothetical protein
MLNLGRKLFKNYDAIGLKEDLESMRYMDCINFFEKQFQNPTKIINVSKNSAFKMDLDFSENESEKTFQLGPYRDVILEPTRNFGDKSSLIMVSKVADSDFNYISFINNMLSLGLSSPLYSEVREKKGLVYYINCHQSRMNKQGATVISTRTSGNNVEKVVDTIKYVLENPNKFLNKRRFELVKKSYEIKYQKDMINRYSNVNLWINPPGWSVKEILPTITYDKVMDVYNQYFNIDDFYISNDRTEFK